MVLKFYSDPSHGWVAVKRSFLKKLGIIKEVSQYSYQSKSSQTVYLEEDCDGTLLVNALKAQGIKYTVKHIVSGYKPSVIRSYPMFHLETFDI